MRVAHLITRLMIGGAQENTILNCQGLLEEFGDDVLLITGPGLGPEGDLVPDARRRGIPLVVLPELRRAVHPWRDWRSLRGIRRALVEFRPHVVHTHSGKAGLLGRTIAYRLNVPAIVHTVHGAPFHPYQGRLARWFFRQCECFAAYRCHAIISVADAMTDQLVAAGVAKRDKFTTIYSGMDVEPFLNAEPLRAGARAELGFRDEDVVVLKIARLFRLKGHDDVLTAATRAVAREPRLQIVFVGDGLARGRLERRSVELGLDRRVHFTGLVPPPRVPALLAASDLVVHASYREGLARVLPQALLVGRPVVSYDVDGAREVVLDGETGYLVAAGDTTALADRIVQLASAEGLRRRFGAAGRRACAESFRHEIMTRKIRHLYERILRQRDLSAFSPSG